MNPVRAGELCGPRRIPLFYVRTVLGGGFILTARRRMRYWSEGAIIGSKSFVREVAAACWGEERAKKKRLARAIDPAEIGDGKPRRVTVRGHVLGLFAWRRFRVF